MRAPTSSCKRAYGGLAVLIALTSAALAADRAAEPDPLLAGFQTPPDAAKPRVWWHWMNANVTREGIKADLEWMHRIGIGGFQNFDGGSSNVPRIVPPVIYMTPTWKEDFRYAMQLGAELGLEGARASSAGWSETGGPWVQPSEAMKKYVWSETWLHGGEAFSRALPAPPHTTGPFMDIPAPPSQGIAALPEYYRDARVFAYRVPEGAVGPDQLPRVTASALAQADDFAPVPISADTSSAPPVVSPPTPPTPEQIRDEPGVPLDAAVLSDGRLQQFVELRRTHNADPTWVRFDYEHPVTITGLTIGTGGINRQFIVGSVFPNFGEPDAGPRLRVDASDDRHSWHAVSEAFYNGAQRTIGLPVTTARSFRIVFLEDAQPPRLFRGGPRTYIPAISLSELRLHTIATVNRLEAKASFASVNDYFAVPNLPAPASCVVNATDVIDLTHSMDAEGRLHWTPPPGRWVVIRLGYSLTGHQNGPAPVEGTGLEVDKLNAGYVAKYMDTYLGLLRDAAGSEDIGARGLQYLVNDSYEAGFQNWTDDLLEQFARRRGYDPAPYLPTLTGVVINSPEATDRFLFDFRRTLNELLAQSHYKVVSEKAHELGLGTYQEAQEDRRAYQGDDMEMRQYADVPMAAMWAFPPDGQPRMTYLADDRGAASVANIYGRRYVAAESFTGGSYDTSPKTIKHVADVMLLNGINRFVVHTSVHQPLDRGPGMSLMGIGVFFSRNEAWAELAGGWVQYLQRASFLMQQGKAATEIAYFYGQDAPITGIWGFSYQNDVPPGYDYDYVNADVILNRLSVKDGWLETATGMRYRLLQMGERTRQITLPVLQKLRDFVQAGAVVLGARPTQSPSLEDDQGQFARIADALWGDGRAGEHVFGRGRVIVGREPGQVLQDLGVSKDFDYEKTRADSTLGWKHRRLDDGDLYFVVNRNTFPQTVDVSLRGVGRSVEQWDPLTGGTRLASYRTKDGRTIVPLEVGPLDSVFLVLRHPGPPARTVREPKATLLSEFHTPWQVQFQTGRGAPDVIHLADLHSWSEEADHGVKYFSGLATYRATLNAPAMWFRERGRLWIDLGDVRELARVTVNGKDLGVTWRAPYRLDLGDALRPGDNDLVIEVANTWVNRLVGDKQPDEQHRVAFSLTNPYNADSPLPASGLLGPISILSLQ